MQPGPRGSSFRSCASGSADSRGTRGARAGDNYAMGPQRMFGMTPWVRRLIVADLAVFLLPVTLFVSPGFLGTLGFAPLLAFRQPWTFLTYTFVHATLLHPAFTLLPPYT